MNVSWLLFALGTLMAIAYWALGMAASSHFKDKEISGQDRFFSTGMLWSLASGRYETEGQRLCIKGNIALVVGIAAWIAWASLR